MKNTMKKIIFLMTLFCISFVNAVVDGNYLFNLESMTQTEITNIVNPIAGAMVFNTSNNSIYYYDGSSWIANSSKNAPFIANSNRKIIAPSTTYTFTLEGENFTPSTVVSIINPSFTGTIDTINILSPSILEVTVTTTATEDIHDIVLSNNGVLNTQWSGNGIDLFEVKTSTWIDLRLGGATFSDGNANGNDIRYRAGMSMSRDANGMSFTGSNPWSSWVKFENLGWTRGSNKTLQWIFSGLDNVMMIGIGSSATNENATDQYQHAEVEAYFSNSTTLWGLYGNNGTVGTAGNQGNSTSLNSCTSGVLKVKFENDGAVGSQFTMYCLPSAGQGDWDNEATVMSTFTIGGSLNPNEVNIMPFIIPRAGGTQRFIAVKVE